MLAPKKKPSERTKTRTTTTAAVTKPTSTTRTATTPKPTKSYKKNGNSKDKTMTLTKTRRRRRRRRETTARTTSTNSTTTRIIIRSRDPSKDICCLLHFVAHVIGELFPKIKLRCLGSRFILLKDLAAIQCCGRSEDSRNRCETAYRA